MDRRHQGRKGAKIVLFIFEEFGAYYDIPDSVFSILDFCQDGIPNNMHSCHATHNQLGLEYRDLMEHLKDENPSYYYTDILIPNGWTLGKFIQQQGG